MRAVGLLWVSLLSLVVSLAGVSALTIRLSRTSWQVKNNARSALSPACVRGSQGVESADQISFIGKNPQKTSMNNVYSLEKESVGLKNGNLRLPPPTELTPDQSRLLLACIAAAYGTNFAVVKSVNDALDPSVASLFRFTLSSAVFLPNVWKYRKEMDVLKGGALMGIFNGLGYFGQSTALNQGMSASTVAFICSLAVVVVPVLDVLFPPESGEKEVEQKDRLLAFLPSFISAAGVYFLTGIGEGTETGTGAVGAYAAAFLQPVLFGIAYWLQPKLVQSCKEPGHYLAFTGSSLTAVALGSAGWVLGAGGADIGVGIGSAISHPAAVIAILWTGLATTAGCTLLENVAMKQLTGTESTVIYSSEPLWGTFFGYALLHEAVGIDTAVGAALILGAIFLSTKLENENKV